MPLTVPGDHAVIHPNGTLACPGARSSSGSFRVLYVNGGVVIRPREADAEPSHAEPLTQRELEILTLVAEGFSNKVIGARLGIREQTVKNHLSYIMVKLQAADRTHAVVTAVRLGWLAL